MKEEKIIMWFIIIQFILLLIMFAQHIYMIMIDRQMMTMIMTLMQNL